MPCILLFRLVIIVLVYNGAPSSILHTPDTSFVPPPTHAVTSPITTSMSRDTSLIITQCLGLPPLYPHPTIPLSAHYAVNLFYDAQKFAPVIFCPQRARRPVLIAFSRTLIILLLCSSGDVEVNPDPVCPQAPSFVDFCYRKSLGFMHINIRSLFPKFVLLNALAHSANPDVSAMSESWLRKATKNSEISIPNYNIFRQDRTAKGGGVSLQSSVILFRSMPTQFELLIKKMNLSRNMSLTVAA